MSTVLKIHEIVQKWAKRAKNMHNLGVLCMLMHIYGFLCIYLLHSRQVKNSPGAHAAITANMYAHDVENEPK
jgi:hypothetical protein